MDNMSRSGKARQRAFSQTPTLEEDEKAGGRKACHNRSSEILDTTYNSQGEDYDSISNGTTNKQRRGHPQASSAYSGHAVAGGFNIGSYMMSQQERGGPSARDVLLLKCKEAIETLHGELEEERNEKQRLSEEVAELHRVIDDLQIQD